MRLPPRAPLDIILRNARAQAQLVSDVLDVSRIVSGKLRLDLREVDLVAVLWDALEVVRPAAEAKNISLSVSAGVVNPRVTGDPDRLQQVLWNLLSNAVKFTECRGSVSVELRRTDSQLELAVSDTGSGIDPAFLPHVFSRFRQADSSTSRQHEGLGLGLAITRHLVELHGGTVQAASEGRGRGATFTLRLPVRAVREVEEAGGTPRAGLGEDMASPPGAVMPSLDGITVLVVDDEADARELVKTVLEPRGARVVLAASSAEGLSLASSERPDLVLADIGMPGEDGYEFIRRFRAQGGPAARAVTAIAFTAYGRPEDRARALAAGFQKHMTKPVLASDLIAAVAALARGGAASG